jgi:hypothetical protein
MKKKWLIFTLMAWLNIANAYVISKTESGKNIKWNLGSNQILVYVNPVPVNNDITIDITNDQLDLLNLTYTEYITERMYTIINDSLTQWNSVSPYEIVPRFQNSNSSVSNGSINSFRFTDDFSYFGSGVIAITSIAYNASTGDILNADVLINQYSSKSINLTLDKTLSGDSNAYLGDVVTHEFGHFLGLSHSELIESSMVYSIFKAQHSIHSDDIAGIKKNYEITENGSLKGRVIAGESTPVFGVHVQAISTKTNDVIQSELTDSTGNFFFENLELDDSYYIMISPVRNLGSLSEYYKNINNQICFQKNFRPTFYSQCGPRAKSRPQAFYLDSNTDYINVGDVTIRCDENLNTEYFGNKFKTTDRKYELLQNYYDTNVLFNGFFTEEEIDEGLTGKGDEFSLDFTQLDSGNLSLDSLMVNVDLNGTGLGSNYEFYVYTKRSDEVSYTLHNSTFDNTGKKLTNLNLQLSLSPTANNNIFDIKIYPKHLSSLEAYEIFSSPNVLTNENNIYSLSASVGFYMGSEFYSLNKIDSFPYDDNGSCTEGTVTHTSSPYVPLKSTIGDAAQASEDENLGISCGTVDIDNGSNSGGMGSFIFGLFAILFLLNIDIIKYNTLSKS